MFDKKNEKQTMSLQFTDDLTVTIIPDSNHEFLMSSDVVAIGFGTTEKNIREHKRTHLDELFESKHFVTGARISGSDPHNKVYWTKRGIVRLGFFIKSERARLFRDWAEDLVINRVEKPKQPTLPSSTETRLEFKELIETIESAAVLCGSHTRLAARLGITPAIFSHIVRRPWLVSDKMQHAIEVGCRNILANDNQVDVEALEALVMVANPKARLTLFNKLKKGGLI